MTQRSVVDISSPPRSKSSDTRPLASSSGGASQASKGLERRRGSVSHLAGAASLHSNATSPDEPRPRSRFSLSSLRWRRGDPPASTSASVSASASVTTSTPATPPLPSREPSGSTPKQQQQQPKSPTAAAASPVLVDYTDVMRASSWGDVGEYGRLLRAHEAASMHSGAGEHDEPLDPDVVVVGAGGVANGPLPPTPSGSAGVLAALAGLASPPYTNNNNAMCHAAHARSIMQVSSYNSSGALASVDGDGDVDADGSDGDSDSFFARNSEEAARGAFRGPAVPHLHPHPHPHAGCRGSNDVDGGGGDDDDDDDDEWGFGGVGAKSRPCGAAGVGVGVGGVEEAESDDEDDDEGSDGPAIEVRRRRPSWAVHHDEHEGDDEDEDDGPPPPPSPPLLRVGEGDSDVDEP